MAGTPGDNPGRRQYPLGGYEAWMINYDFVYKNLQDVQDYWYQFR